MKVKSAFPIILISLLALAVVIGVPSAVTATMNPLKFKSKATKVAPRPEPSENKNVAKNYTISGALSGDNQGTSAGQLDSISDNDSAQTPSINPSQTAKKVAASPKNADYWFDKGALCATYGNEKAAIKYFQKVISLDPLRSGAYFEQGISYGQLEEYAKALDLINKALELESQNGMYYYGRGRVYMLAGKIDKAMEDFKRAARLDDEDAQTYLQFQSSNQ
jgi:tetratricopeptide (TPR) repeat protein